MASRSRPKAGTRQSVSEGGCRPPVVYTSTSASTWARSTLRALSSWRFSSSLNRT